MPELNICLEQFSQFKTVVVKKRKKKLSLDQEPLVAIFPVNWGPLRLWNCESPVLGSCILVGAVWSFSRGWFQHKEIVHISCLQEITTNVMNETEFGFKRVSEPSKILGKGTATRLASRVYSSSELWLVRWVIYFYCGSRDYISSDFSKLFEFSNGSRW